MIFLKLNQNVLTKILEAAKDWAKKYTILKILAYANVWFISLMKTIRPII